MPNLLGRGLFYIEADASDELMSSEDAHAAVAAVCVQIRDQARLNNPSADERPYIYAAHVDTPDGEPAQGEVGYASAIWHIIEFGSVKNPPYRPLTAAAESAGLRFEPG